MELKENIKKGLKKFFPEEKISFSWRRVWFVVAVFFIIVAVFFIALFAHAQVYKNKVLPGVMIGNVVIGGMDSNELTGFLQTMNDKFFAEGIIFSFELKDEKDSLIVYPIVAEDGVVSELMRIDIEKEVRRLVDYGKDEGFFVRLFKTIFSRFQKTHLVVENIEIEEEKVVEEVRDHAAKYEKEPQDATIVIINTDPLRYDITSSSPGVGFNYDNIGKEIINQWSVLKMPEITMKLTEKNPLTTEEDLRKIEDRLVNVIENGSITLNYVDPHTKREYNWVLSINDIIVRLEVQDVEESGFGFGLSQELIIDYLEDNVAEVINIEAQDAKFEIDENGKVKAFQGSRPGLAINLEETYKVINEAFLQRTWHDEGVAKVVQLVVKTVEPNIKTGEVNDLGISEVLGVGVSDYSNSPYNRIANIRNAVNKLNGILIKPDEEFSTIKYTEPFTIAGGYLPELVIKGNEIKPEVGGGLCQIGTTLFRMAMNSAMPITERRNHSLVVSHYNDPVNGLPGTDATVYDPSPDFKFLNDTGNYILLQTYMDVNKEELVFTLWGTSDGREGSYTHPRVLRWIPYGAAIETETTTLAPGTRKCQNAFRGAEASFTYTIKFPDGTVEEEVFSSYYRPLPSICLVGVEKEGGEGGSTEENSVTEETAGTEQEKETVED